MTEFETTDEMQLKYADRIRKLLEKAESTNSPHEADALTEKAQELMTRYQIDAALIHGSAETPDEIAQKNIDHTGIFGPYKRSITGVIARHNNGFSVIQNLEYARPKAFRITVTGYTSDLERIELLDASAQIQCVRALKAWEREQSATNGWDKLPGWQKYKDRRSFTEAYATGLDVRLAKAVTDATKAAATERASQTGSSVQEETTGVALALRDRKESVKDWYDKFYGHGLKTVRSRHAAGSYGSRQAGYAAGQRADIGQTGVQGGRRAIGR